VERRGEKLFEETEDFFIQVKSGGQMEIDIITEYKAKRILGHKESRRFDVLVPTGSPNGFCAMCPGYSPARVL